MTQNALALIVAPPGALRENLPAVLVALPGIETVAEVDSVAQATALQRDPALVLLSIEGAGAGNLADIAEIKARWPAVRCVALVDTVAQERAALTVGAEEALVKGVRAQKLLGRIEGLLGQPTSQKPGARTGGTQAP